MSSEKQDVEVKKEVKAQPKLSNVDTNQEKLAIVRIRGNIGINPKIKSTLTMLNLHNQNICTVYVGTPSVLGMVKKIKDYVTWGEVEPDTINLLEERKDSKEHKFYRLNNPIKGHARKGIKKAFSVGGALGYRGKKINDLIKSMCH
jgi:large subunit ribosomal protein L30